MKRITHSQLIDLMGGTTAVAKAVELEQSAISHWRRRGIPKAYLRLFRLQQPELFKTHRLRAPAKK